MAEILRLGRKAIRGEREKKETGKKKRGKSIRKMDKRVNTQSRIWEREANWYQVNLSPTCIPRLSAVVFLKLFQV